MDHMTSALCFSAVGPLDQTGVGHPPPGVHGPWHQISWLAVAWHRWQQGDHLRKCHVDWTPPAPPATRWPTPRHHPPLLTRRCLRWPCLRTSPDRWRFIDLLVSHHQHGNQSYERTMQQSSRWVFLRWDGGHWHNLISGGRVGHANTQDPDKWPRHTHGWYLRHFWGRDQVWFIAVYHGRQSSRQTYRPLPSLSPRKTPVLLLNVRVPHQSCLAAGLDDKRNHSAVPELTTGKSNRPSCRLALYRTLRSLWIDVLKGFCTTLFRLKIHKLWSSNCWSQNRLVLGGRFRWEFSYPFAKIIDFVSD